MARLVNPVNPGVREPWRRFLAFNGLGVALWADAWVSLGCLAGCHVGAVYHDITATPTTC